MGKAIDHTGVRYGKAVGIRPTGKSGNSQQRIWLWKCDCGAEFESIASNFIRNSYSPGCQACVTAARKCRVRTHGRCGTREYRAWRSVKRRVFDPNNPCFPVYSRLGMDRAMAESFEVFYQEIGEYPTDGVKYSVDRIDNSRGYVKGNIRWATAAQQARNRGMGSNNTSGTTGVYAQETRPGYFLAVAAWYDLTGKYRTKSFSFNKYGEEEAFRLACQYREERISCLNEQGAHYSPDHGK